MEIACDTFTIRQLIYLGFFHRLKKCKTLWPVHQRSFLSIRHPIDPLFRGSPMRLRETSHVKSLWNTLSTFISQDFFLSFYALKLLSVVAAESDKKKGGTFGNFSFNKQPLINLMTKTLFLNNPPLWFRLFSVLSTVPGQNMKQHKKKINKKHSKGGPTQKLDP